MHQLLAQGSIFALTYKANYSEIKVIAYYLKENMTFREKVNIIVISTVFTKLKINRMSISSVKRGLYAKQVHNYTYFHMKSKFAT